MVQWLVIGISGVTCAGKSTLANSLLTFFKQHKGRPIPNTAYEINEAKLISQDNYFLPVNDKRHQWIEKLNHINWEILSSLDMSKMISDISNIIKHDHFIYTDRQLRNGTNPSTGTFQHLTKVNILIIEGFLILNQPELLQMCHLKFHLHIPYEKCYARRRMRTYDPPDCIGYFEMVVWPMYEEHFREFKTRKDVIMLNGDICQERLLTYVLKCVQLFL